MAIRPQPAHIKWPFDEKTAEGIEKNFRTLFQDTKALSGVVPVEQGGTGQTDFDEGDILYAPEDGVVDGLPIESSGRFLRSDGDVPEWSVLTLPNAATVGDLLYASATNVMSMLAGVATGNALISGGIATAPSWGKIGLTTHVSGVLPIANGGTNISTYAQGDMLYASATDVLAKLAKNTSATRYISNTGTSNGPAWAQIDLTNGVTGDLPFSNIAQASAASRLLGRGSAAGAGDWQEITLGTGLAMSGTELQNTSTGSDWDVLTNGDPDFPEIIFADGEVIMVES